MYTTGAFMGVSDKPKIAGIFDCRIRFVYLYVNVNYYGNKIDIKVERQSN